MTRRSTGSPISWLSYCLALALLQGCGPMDGTLEIVQQGWAVNQVCGGPNSVEGIDVSKYQTTVNWQSVKGAGIVFAFARVSDGLNHPDAYFAGNWTGMKQAGIIRGAYQYFRPSQDAQSQAQLMIQAIQNAGGLQPDDLPPVIDLETMEGMSASAVMAKMDTWLNAVKQAFNRTPIIYTGSYFWDGGGFSSSYAFYPLWVPNYTTEPCPKVPATWPQWRFWQYSDQGSVAGVTGNVDVNKFNGTLTELQTFIASTGSSPPPQPPPPQPPPPPPPGGETPPPGSQQPQGHLEGASCQGIVGWAHDPDNPQATVHVQVYIDQAPGQGQPDAATNADLNRPDLCGALGSCNHGFNLQVPARFLDGEPHQVQVMALDTNGAATIQLSGGPRSFSCTSPDPPPGQPPSDPGTGIEPGTQDPTTPYQPTDPGSQGATVQGAGCSAVGAERTSGPSLLALLLLGLVLRRRVRQEA